LLTLHRLRSLDYNQVSCVFCLIVSHTPHTLNCTSLHCIARLLPANSENLSGPLLDCLTPLQRLTSAGMCVFLPHHPRKGKTQAGQAARGSGVLPSFVDIIMEMSHFTCPDDPDRRRRLVAFSRHSETPRHLLKSLPTGRPTSPSPI
jgi:hypothetical protein